MTKTKSVSIILIRQAKMLKEGLEVKRLDKRQIEYMARTIMPELYEWFLSHENKNELELNDKYTDQTLFG